MGSTGGGPKEVEVPNLRLKVLTVVDSLVQLVTSHIQEEVAVSEHSNLYYLPLIHHSLMTRCPLLWLGCCANLLVPEHTHIMEGILQVLG